MNPLYLGTAERRIFAIHEPAAITGARPRAAVLCHPWGAEYIYAHRAVRQLALKLSMAGFHTLRFDYFGTGDSGGEISQADLAGWETDTEAALETVKDIAGVSKVALVGLRIGANVAAGVARRLPAEVESLVLWDPIVSGPAYSASLQAKSRSSAGAAEAPAAAGAGEAALQELQVLQVDGFPLTPCMLRDFEAIDLRSIVPVLPKRTLILITERDEARQALGAGECPSADVVFLSAPCPWIESATTTGALPVPAIQRIEEWLR